LQLFSQIRLNVKNITSYTFLSLAFASELFFGFEISIKFWFFKTHINFWKKILVMLIGAHKKGSKKKEKRLVGIVSQYETLSVTLF
jgi:hypothetical protein